MAGLGEFCQETGVSVDALATGLLPKIQDLKKGLIHELNAYRKAHDVSWKDYYGWIEQMCENPAILPTLETFKVYVGRLEKKRSELLRNKNQNELMLLMAQPFCCTKKARSYVSLSDIPPSKHAESTFDFEVLQKVNAEISAELHEANAALHDEQNKTEKLATKLNKLSVRNVNKKLRRRDDRIHSAECQIYSLTQNIEAKTETVEKLERDLESATQANHRSRSKVYRSSKQVEVVQMGMVDIQSKLAHLEKQFDSRVSSLMNKTQLDFRKKVLEPAHPDKSVFFITRHSRQLSITEISNNLGRLLSSSQTQSSPISPSVTLNCESLIGKEINHRWKSEGGVERWYRGTVLSLVPGTADWFNVQYEGEDDVMSLNLLMDIENGDLDIVGSS